MPIALAALGSLSALAWLGLLLRPSRPWDLTPVGEEATAPPEPAAWPSVRALVPARNESAVLLRTLPPLLAQDYPGDFAVVVVDDRSGDGTADLARGLGGETVAGAPLPEGWVGKVWALEQAAHAAGEPAYLLLTDADIRHAPGSLRRLVAESEAAGLALNSRMARLRCSSPAERLLIPPFLFFFNLLYPMRLVNDPRSAVAAAAGGCVLLRRGALERAGGFAAIAGEAIDDVNLARRIKGLGEPIRLAVSRSDVESLRAYGSVGAVWRMVRRTAFVELRRSWTALAGTLAGLALLFALPPALVVLAAVRWWLALPGALAWAVMAHVFRPSGRFFGLGALWAWTLPVAGCLYGLMTLDSALRSLRGRRPGW